MPARAVALRVLERVRRDGAFSGAVLSKELRAGSLDERDASLATYLVNGVLAHEGVLDEVIAMHVRRLPEPRVVDILRLASFELLYSRAAAYAVVDEAVSAVRRIRPAAAGMVNAVLRRVADSARTFPWGDPKTDRAALGRATGHPAWIVDLAFDALGDVAPTALLADDTPAPSFIRLDPFARPSEVTLASLADAHPRPSAPDPDCYVLDAPAQAYRNTGAQTGWFAMDAAAQIAPAACVPEPGQRVLDVGAGRGNKTICLQAIAARQGAPAAITAVDVSESKIERLRARLDRSAVPGVEIRAVDAADAIALQSMGTFDAVLVDAPCTGLGTLRRYPEKRWRLRPDDPERMAALQEVLLRSACGCVGASGRLVYSTCSFAPAENRQIVRRFLGSEEGSAFRLAPIGDVIPSEWGMFICEDGSFQSYPTPSGPDGHYVAVLVRDGS